MLEQIAALDQRLLASARQSLDQATGSYARSFAATVPSNSTSGAVRRSSALTQLDVER